MADSEQHNWTKEYYNMLLEGAFKEEDTPDNNGYYL